MKVKAREKSVKSLQECVESVHEVDVKLCIGIEDRIREIHIHDNDSIQIL